MAAGSILIDLRMATAGFQTDTARAEKRLKQFQKEAERVGAVIGTAIAGGVVAAVYAFDALLKSADAFNDFADTVGATGAEIAGLAVAAATAGVGMEVITGHMNKLTKGLVGVDDESKAVGAALKAIGIEIEDFKRLGPVEQYEAVGRALSGFADGAGKSAVAMSIFGRGGAEQLKVFKALEAQGGRTNILTQQQIDLAGKYADETDRLTAALKLYAQAALIGTVGYFNDLIEDAGKAETALDKFGFALKVLSGASLVDYISGLDTFGKKADYAASEMQRLQGMSGARKIGIEYDGGVAAKQLIADNAKVTAANVAAGKIAADAAKGAAKDAASAAERRRADAASYLEGLDKEYRQTEDLTRVEQVLADISSGRFKEAKAGQAMLALTIAAEIDQTKQLTEANVEAAKREVEWADAREASSNRLRAAGESVFEATRKPAEQYSIELERLNALMQAGAINAETYGRAVIMLQDKFDENAQRIKAISQEINASVEGDFADAFAGFIDGSLSAKDAFSQFAKSVIADMSRIASQQLAKSLFGGDAQGQSSWITGLAGLFGGSGLSGTGSYNELAAMPRAGGGTVGAGGSYMVGERGPERFVPSTAGRIVPNEALAGRGDIQVVTPPGMPLTVQKLEERQSDGRILEKLILSTVARDARQGGPAIQATAGVLGSRRTLPRRGY